MRCYAHSEREALGACIGCGKGICLDCLNRISGKMYCDGCMPSSGVVKTSLERLEEHITANPFLEDLQHSARTGIQKFKKPVRDISKLIGSSNRNRYLASILAFSLGWCGAHKFYLGQKGWGIVYFLFFWTPLPLMASWIEGALYLTRPEEEFTRRYGRTVPTMQRPELNASFDYARRQIASQRPPKTAAEHERFLLKIAREQKGLISVPHLLMEYHLKLENVELALASLSAQGLVQSDFDDSGHVRYFVTEFR